MDPESDLYLLPSHPSILSNDPLSVCDQHGDSLPTAWMVFEHSVAAFRDHTPSLWHLPNLVQDLIYSIHGNGNVDVNFLWEVIQKGYPNHHDEEAQSLLNHILDSALAMPALFPDHSIQHLSAEYRQLSFNKEQIKCLVAHQLLGTLKPPKGNDWGCTFLCWYKSHQPLKKIVRGYITTAFRYLMPHSPIQNLITYEYYSLPVPTLEMADAWMASPARVFDSLNVGGVRSDAIEFPHPHLKAMVVSSSKSPGFGPSCTQEELVTAACPDILPLGALCVRPPIPDDAALVAEGVIPTSRWVGQRRSAKILDFNESLDEHLFLFIDASELDLAPPSLSKALPDLREEYLLRDIHKAFVGFSAARAKGVNEISSPVWGTGSFCGDPVVKALILALAATLSGMSITLIVDQERDIPSERPDLPPQKLVQVLEFLKSMCQDFTVHDIWVLLRSPAGQECTQGMQIMDLLVRS